MLPLNIKIKLRNNEEIFTNNYQHGDESDVRERFVARAPQLALPTLVGLVLRHIWIGPLIGARPADNTEILIFHRNSCSYFLQRLPKIVRNHTHFILTNIITHISF